MAGSAGENGIVFPSTGLGGDKGVPRKEGFNSAESDNLKNLGFKRPAAPSHCAFDRNCDQGRGVLFERVATQNDEVR